MRILLLGGIGEAAELARRLASLHALTYSVAGKGRRPELPCAVRVGGFGGVAGLIDFLITGGFDLLVDATHPYAEQISRHATLAAAEAGIPLWAYRRPPWRPRAGDDWLTVADWAEIEQALQVYRRPCFTIGLEPLRHCRQIPSEQHWLVRCLAPQTRAIRGLTVLNALGPFSLEQELELLGRHQADVLVSKNSGGSAVAAKLVAARQLEIPVLMLARPSLPAAAREFGDIETLYDCLAKV